MSIYTEIKLGKLKHLYGWLLEEKEASPSDELSKLISRVEQQITFLELPEEEGRKYFEALSPTVC